MSSKLTNHHKVTLPQATISIPARQIPDAVPLPHLKLTVTPQVAIPDDIAPRNAKGKAVEEAFKTVVPIGGKVVVSWHVDTTALFGVGRHDDAPHIQSMLEDKVLEWLEKNEEMLGVERMEPSRDKRTQLTILPRASNPMRSPFTRHMIPHGEPTAHLKRLGIELSWAYPSKSRKRRLGADASDGEDPYGPEGPLASSTFRQRHSSQHTASENVVLSGSAPAAYDLCTELVSQVGGGMLQVLRMQMIRRFVFVFDPDFETYQEPLSVPPAIFTAIGRFLFLSAARNTPLLGHCKILLESIQSTQKEQLRRRVLDMARVATYKTKKRVRTDSQVNMLDARERLEMQDDDQGATRMVEYLERLRLADRTSDDDKIHRSFSEGVAAIGATRWARARRSGMARMSARKVELVEVAADAVPPLEAELGDEYLADHDSDMAAAERYDIILPRPLRTSLHHPVAPRTSIVELPEDEDNDEVVDDLADWDSSEDYVVTPPPHLQTGSPEYHIDDHDYAHNFIRHRSNSLGLSHVGVRDSIDFDSGRMNSLPRDGVLAGAEDTPLWEHVQARLAGYSLRDRMAPRTQYDDEVINDLDDEATWSPGFHPRLGSLPVAGDLDAEEDPFYYEEASRQDSFEECPDGSQGGAGAPTSHPHWAPAPAPLIHPRPPHLQAIETSATPSPIIRLPERLVEEGGMPGAGLAASYVSYPEAWDEGGGGGGHEVEVQIEDDRGREEVVYRGEGYGASRGHGEYAGHEGEGSQGWPSGDGAGHSAEHAAGEVYNDLDEW